MSRYRMPMKDAAMYAILGWDPPLGTFYFQGFDPRKLENGPKIWLGATLKEMPTLASFLEATAELVELPVEMHLALAADRVVNDGFDRGAERDKLLALVLGCVAFDRALALDAMALVDPRPSEKHPVLQELVQTMAQRAAQT